MPTAKYFKFIFFFFAVTAIFSACSLKRQAARTVTDLLSGMEGVYLGDDDPRLIEMSLPSNLKLMEAFLESDPYNKELLVTLTKTFSFYSYAFVQLDAEAMEDVDFRRAEEIRNRAAKLYKRAYGYGLRALETQYPGIRDMLIKKPKAAASRIEPKDVDAAVWTAAALGGAASSAKDDPEVTADISLVGALLRRALELDEDYEQGVIHEYLMSYEAQFPGGTVEKAREHYLRALELSDGKKCSLWVDWAEMISVARQDREQFVELLQRALAFDVDSAPKYRLFNILAQQRAERLLSKTDELFL